MQGQGDQTEALVSAGFLSGEGGGRWAVLRGGEQRARERLSVTLGQRLRVRRGGEWVCPLAEARGSPEFVGLQFRRYDLARREVLKVAGH